jgi:hypothetical protein
MPPYGSRETRERELREREAELRGEGLVPAAQPKLSPDVDALLASPAVQAAIADQVAKATADIVAKIEAARGTVPAEAGADKKFAEHLAVSIAQLIDQGNPRAKRAISPDLLASRDAARGRMEQAIIDARMAGRVPEYKLVGEVYLSETFIAREYAGDDHKMRQRYVAWPLAPSLAMRPANETAEEIFRHFCAWIGHLVEDNKGPDDPLITGFRIIDESGGAAQTGAGQGALSNDGVRIRDNVTPGHHQDGVRILGSVAEPARPNPY